MNMLLEDSTTSSFQDPALYWNLVALDVNRLAHSLKGSRQGGPPMSARALGIVHLAMHDAWFGIVGAQPGFDTWLTRGGAKNDIFRLPAVPPGADPAQALAAAAYSALHALYMWPAGAGKPNGHQENAAGRILAFLGNRLAAARPRPNIADAGFQFGVKVARRIVTLMEVRADEPGVDDCLPGGVSYLPSQLPGKFREDPTNPIIFVDKNGDGVDEPRRDFHGPFYGASAARFAAQRAHINAEPPSPSATDAEYMQSYRAVYALGGAAALNTTHRSPDQTVSGLYWAYDGANLLGTPPRLYNQIVRTILASKRLPSPDAAYSRQHTNESVRLLALTNIAMADAGVFAWAEKYQFEYWRPLSGVREHDPNAGPSGSANHASPIVGDPFWTVLGAPRTNTNGISFKPPFPAYPSGHATFGAAAFQMVRRYYAARDGVALDPRGVDNIAFTFVSDELDGRSRELYQSYKDGSAITDQPGNVRTRVVRRFDSLWEAIRDNGLSRVYLGVHWLFDAFARNDGLNGDVANDGSISLKSIADVHYATTGQRLADDGALLQNLPIGGVPLGLEIADEIFDSGMARTPVGMQPKAIQKRYASTTSPGGIRTLSKRMDEAPVDTIEGLTESIRSWSTAGKTTDTNIR
ncbi:MAG: phosphatase PAP2 family protein [Xanthomonadaceae bacterium]|nr:phosphatase PAP2 family protein [Xanthomonadaceae bacterium]